MKNNKANVNLIDKSDWDIDEEDFDAHFARLLSKDKKKIENFKKRVIREFNETKSLGAFLEHLKVIAMAERKTAIIAEKTKMKRPNVYRILSKDSNPSFLNLSTIAHNLGINFKAVAV
jgi:DNA-binding phage protein